VVGRVQGVHQQGRRRDGGRRVGDGPVLQGDRHALLAGVINPIIAAIFGKADISDIGFTINGARFSIGLVITAIINFVVVALVLFAIVKAYNRFKRTAPPDPPTQELIVLTQIRDELRAGRGPS
jgi:large conductance mechanosensitive channel